MKRLTCEMCGGTDLIKINGVFECQTCGCKYSVEEAKKMMIEGTVEVSGTVKIDKSESIKNYFDLAKNASDAGNFREAEEYCNKILETDLSYWEAWYLKGMAVCWQSTGANIRMTEATNSFLRALDCCPEEDWYALSEDCRDVLMRFDTAVIKLIAEKFRIKVDRKAYNELVDMVYFVINNTQEFLGKTGIEATGLEFRDSAAVLNSELNDEWFRVQEKYHGNDGYPTEYDLICFIEKGDILLDGFKLALILCGEKEDDEKLNELKISIYNNMISVQKKLRKGQAYNFDASKKRYKKGKSLSVMEKSRRLSIISSWEAQIEQIETEGAQKVAEAKRRRWELYWKYNVEKKETLEAEKASLEEKIAEFNRGISAIPGESEKKNIQEQIDMLVVKKKDIGAFKVKDRRAVQEKIEELRREMSFIDNRMNNAKLEIEEQISPLQSRINEIIAEFEKPR